METSEIFLGIVAFRLAALLLVGLVLQALPDSSREPATRRLTAPVPSKIAEAPFKTEPMQQVVTREVAGLHAPRWSLK